MVAVGRATAGRHLRGVDERAVPRELFTATGRSRVVTVPSPSCPNVLRPQQSTTPVRRSAHVWFGETAIVLTFARNLLPATAFTPVGRARGICVPSPRVPNWLSPQQRAEPSDCTEQESYWLTEIQTWLRSGPVPALFSTGFGSGWSTYRVVTEREIAVVTPAVDCRVGQPRARVVLPRRDLDHARQRPGARLFSTATGSRAAGSGAVAELPVGVVAPAVETTARQQRACEEVAGHDLGHAGERTGAGRVLHEDRGHAPGARAGPELTVLVQSRARHGSIRHPCTFGLSGGSRHLHDGRLRGSGRRTPAADIDIVSNDTIRTTRDARVIWHPRAGKPANRSVGPSNSEPPRMKYLRSLRYEPDGIASGHCSSSNCASSFGRLFGIMWFVATSR